MKLLITGFGPFLDVVDNPSAILAAQLPGDTVVLPVQYGRVEAFCRGELDYDAILCLGLSAKAAVQKFEVYAHNQIGTVRGHKSRQHRREVIRPSGPKTLGQTLASPAQMATLSMEKSYTPGDYLCNFLLYSLLIRHPRTRIGFVHVPPVSEVGLEEQLGQLEGLLSELELG